MDRYCISATYSRYAYHMISFDAIYSAVTKFYQLQLLHGANLVIYLGVNQFSFCPSVYSLSARWYARWL